MSTYSNTHDGVERIISGMQTISSSFARDERNAAPQIFVVVGLLTAAAAALTAWWVAPIEGGIAYQWIGVWTLAVLGVLALTRIAYATLSNAPQILSGWAKAYRARRDDERLMELAKWDHRLADEIRVIRWRNQTDH
jgi:hypothetical protein